MLRLELDTADLERLAAAYGRDIQLVADRGGRLVAIVRGLKLLGIGSLTARIGLGPIDIDEDTGVLALPIELLSLAGIRLGRKLITKKVLDLLRRRKWPEVTVDPINRRVTVDTARLLGRVVPLLGGYRVVRARFASRRNGATLMLALGDEEAGRPTREK